MERHAEQCFGCGKELSDARNLRRLTAGLARVKAPADFEASICRKIAKNKSQGIFAGWRHSWMYGFPLWMRFASSAAICAILFMGILYIWRTPQTTMIPIVNSTPSAVPAAPAAEETPSMSTQRTTSPIPAVSEKPIFAPPAAKKTPEPSTQWTASAPVPVKTAEAPALVRSDEPEIAEVSDRQGAEAMDLLLIGPDTYPAPERLPKKIRIRYGPPSEEYFIMRVSH